MRGVLTARLGPVPRLAFIKDIHYDPAAALERLVARTGLLAAADSPPTDDNNDDMVEALLSDLRLGADAAELRRDAILKVIYVTAAKSRAEHRSGSGGSGGDERNRDLADEFVQVTGECWCILYFKVPISVYRTTGTYTDC